jgi:RNase adapter protein RapZ
VIPRYVSEGKAHLTIAIGCTGGRHRSVAISEHLAERYRARDDVFVEVVHRDVERGERIDLRR